MFFEYIAIIIFLCILLLTIYGIIFISFKRKGAEFLQELEKLERETAKNRNHLFK